MALTQYGACRGVTIWQLYKFTITAKMGFMYHIPGPDEDPDDPKTNTCPLDPVLENKLNMLAALPKQVFGMLVPKHLPDVRALMPYSLRLPHARDALDCKFDFMGPVSLSRDELEDIKAFHAAMMEGPQKKKDPKKVAEELKKLTEAARKALGQDLPDLHAAEESQAAQKGSAHPALVVTEQPAADRQAAGDAAMAAASQAAPKHQDPSVTPPGEGETPAAEAGTVSSAQEGTHDKPSDSAPPAPDGATAAAPEALQATLTPAKDSADPDASKPAPPEAPVYKWDELTRFKEGQEDGEDKFVASYYTVPLTHWADWEDPHDVPDESFPKVDWEAVRHVRYGWKPLTSVEEVSSLDQAPAADAMDVDQHQVDGPHTDEGQVDKGMPNGGDPVTAGSVTEDKSTNPVDASAAGDKSVPAAEGAAQEPEPRDAAAGTSPKAVKLGPLDPQRLANSVVVTTYNSTPYFYEGIDSELTPESRFPDDKLKLQMVVVEQEEEDEFLKPRPPKEAESRSEKQANKPDQATADKPDQAADKPDQDPADKDKAAEAAGAAGGGGDADEMVVKLIASRQAATFSQYFR